MTLIFGIANPRLAMAGFNPHAGESGARAGDVYVQVSIWERSVTLGDGRSFQVFDVTLRKRYKDGQTGEFKSTDKFQGNELYAAVHALEQAMRALAEDTEAAARYAIQAKERAARCYSIGAVANRHMALYRDLDAVASG